MVSSKKGALVVTMMTAGSDPSLYLMLYSCLIFFIVFKLVAVVVERERGEGEWSVSDKNKQEKQR